jgi:hypothetical protein
MRRLFVGLAASGGSSEKLEAAGALEEEAVERIPGIERGVSSAGWSWTEGLQTYWWPVTETTLIRAA